MKKKNAENWSLQPQEQEGSYFFSGKIFMTSGIQFELDLLEISDIISTIKYKVQKEVGLDYLQVFKKQNSKRKIFVIDNLNKEMKQNKDQEFLNSNDYFTIMFAEEY